MRNPFARVAKTETARPSLRQRLKTTKAKAKQVLAVNRVLLKPEAKPAPVDRVALVNYASWLFMERRMVCRELYPHMGPGADRFVLTANAAEAFHFPLGIFPSPSTTEEKASARAVKVLDMVGVDWRSDLTDSGRGHLDSPSRRDTGERPAVPYGWPKVDSELLDALDNLNRLDAAQAAMGKVGIAERDLDTVPGYDGLEDARSEALDRLGKARAESLIGLQVKARALLTQSVSDIAGEAFAEIAESLARDLLGATNSIIEPRPDPIFAAIKECERLEAACAAEYAKASDGDSTDSQSEAVGAVFDQWRGVVLKTVPTTDRGCAALARFAPGFSDRWASSLDSPDTLAVFDLISRSPML